LRIRAAYIKEKKNPHDPHPRAICSAKSAYYKPANLARERRRKKRVSVASPLRQRARPFSQIMPSACADRDKDVSAIL